MTGERAPDGWQDPIAHMLCELAFMVETHNVRPPPTTIAALRRINGVLAAHARRNGLAPDYYLTWGDPAFPEEPPPEPRHA